MIPVIAALVLVVIAAAGAFALERRLDRGDRMPQSWLDRQRRGSR